MIESKFSKSRTWVGIISTLISPTIVSILFLDYFRQINLADQTSKLPLSFSFIPMALFFIGYSIYYWFTLSKIIIDKGTNSISFTKIATGKIKNYSMTEFDRFEKNWESRGRFGKTEVLYLIKKRQRIETIAKYKYANYEELVKAICVK